MELTPTQALEKFQEQLVPVVSAGEFVCEYKTCDVTQDHESKDDMLFFNGDYEPIMCKEHIIQSQFNQWLRDNDITLKE